MECLTECQSNGASIAMEWPIDIEALIEGSVYSVDAYLNGVSSGRSVHRMECLSIGASIGMEYNPNRIERKVYPFKVSPSKMTMSVLKPCSHAKPVNLLRDHNLPKKLDSIFGRSLHPTQTYEAF